MATTIMIKLAQTYTQHTQIFDTALRFLLNNLG